jgi:hypothetical protein
LKTQFPAHRPTPQQCLQTECTRERTRRNGFIADLSSFRCNFFLCCYLRPALRRPSKVRSKAFNACRVPRASGGSSRLGRPRWHARPGQQSRERAGSRLARTLSVPVTVSPTRTRQVYGHMTDRDRAQRMAHRIHRQ